MERRVEVAAGKRIPCQPAKNGPEPAYILPGSASGARAASGTEVGGTYCEAFVFSAGLRETVGERIGARGERETVKICTLTRMALR